MDLTRGSFELALDLRLVRGERRPSGPTAAGGSGAAAEAIH